MLKDEGGRMSGDIETYFTIDKKYGPEEIKEKGSRFIAYLYPAGTREATDLIVAGLRKKYYDASHVCFAYRLGKGHEAYFRYNDDGEPSGTAGLPIYSEIKSKEYFNVLAVVVRYFGGTKLGTGGLTRAYSQAAKKVLDISKRITVHIKQRVSVSFPFDFTGEIMQLVNRFSLDIVNQDYSADGIVMQLDVPVGKVDEVTKQIVDRSGGKVKPAFTQ
ncbi:MAG: YigZ family protein [Candidatus Aminicenantes bacterium]|nr:MAG: YigZ family protein [Candidatus Aminicenantes bacterium]